MRFGIVETSSSCIVDVAVAGLWFRNLELSLSLVLRELALVQSKARFSDEHVIGVQPHTSSSR